MKLRVPAYVPPASYDDAVPVEIELNLPEGELEAYMRWVRGGPDEPLTSEVEWTATDIRTAIWWALGRPVTDPLDIGFLGADLEVMGPSEAGTVLDV